MRSIALGRVIQNFEYLVIELSIRLSLLLQLLKRQLLITLLQISTNLWDLVRIKQLCIVSQHMLLPEQAVNIPKTKALLAYLLEISH